MKLNALDKKDITDELTACFSGQHEVRKVVIFGSFLNSDEPGDVDVAVLQDSDEGYLSLAMRYRRLTRPIAKRLPVDIVPIRTSATTSAFLAELDDGRVIYER